MATWYESRWAKRIPITIPATSVGESLSDFPVFLNESGMPDSFFMFVHPAGNDILITNDRGEVLPYSVKHIDASNKKLELHFLADLSSIYNNNFYLYYRNGNCPAIESPSSVWVDTLAVFHLSENGAITDESVNVLSGVDHNQSTGKEGYLYATGGQEFDGDEDYYEIVDDPLLDTILSEFTFSAWLKPTTMLGSYGHILNRVGVMDIYIIPDGSLVVSLVQSGLARAMVTPAASLTFGIWNDVRVSWGYGLNERKPVICIDGEVVSVSGTIPILQALDSSSESLIIGGVADSFYGQMDEVKIDTVARSEEWMVAQNLNQSNISSFLAAGDEQQISALFHLRVD